MKEGGVAGESPQAPCSVREAFEHAGGRLCRRGGPGEGHGETPRRETREDCPGGDPEDRGGYGTAGC